MSESMALVGLDVHRAQTVAAVDVVWQKIGVQLSPVAPEAVTRFNNDLRGGLEVTAISGTEALTSDIVASSAYASTTVSSPGNQPFCWSAAGRLLPAELVGTSLSGHVASVSMPSGPLSSKRTSIPWLSKELARAKMLRTSSSTIKTFRPWRPLGEFLTGLGKFVATFWEFDFRPRPFVWGTAIVAGRSSNRTAADSSASKSSTNFSNRKQRFARSFAPSMFNSR